MAAFQRALEEATEEKNGQWTNEDTAVPVVALPCHSTTSLEAVEPVLCVAQVESREDLLWKSGLFSPNQRTAGEELSRALKLNGLFVALFLPAVPMF